MPNDQAEEEPGHLPTLTNGVVDGLVWGVGPVSTRHPTGRDDLPTPLIVYVSVQGSADVLEVNRGQIPAPLAELGLMRLGGDRLHRSVVFDCYEHT